MILALVVMAQLLSVFIVPEAYTSFFSQVGGQYQTLSNLPLIGLVLRLVYAILSPFPWINFDQWILYGFNAMFLGVHMLSVLLASWVIFSLFGRARRILHGSDDIRACVTFGVAIMASLAVSAIGYHVYLAPALPFLAALLYEPSNQIAYRYPIIFVTIMEMVAQGARLLG
jgi:fumarate reductase subunit D